ncbi:MAG: hypothetical protein GX444_20150 [Myxococcales bacterium]|nr:hypothetical protein [Myxococcales bacterium]
MKRAMLLVTGLLVVSFAAACGMFESKLTPGREVFAAIGTDDWHHGTIMKDCPGGLSVKLDGDVEGCYPKEKIVLDQPPQAGEIKPGVRVLAQFQNGNYLPGVVKSIVQTKYNIAFVGGELGVDSLEQLRLLP